MTDHRHDLHHRAPDVADDGVRISDVREDRGVREAREHFGGIDVPATLAGTVAALGATVLVGGLLGGLGTIGYQTGVGTGASDAGLSLAGFGAGVVTLLLAFLLGGWVAGRMSRYDGGRNGLMTAVWFLVLTAGLAGLGAWAGDRYDVLSRFDLPQWFRNGDLTGAAIASALVAVAVMLAAAWFGGRLGDRYHERADRLIVDTRPGGLTRPSVAEVRVQASAGLSGGARREARRRSGATS